MLKQQKEREKSFSTTYNINEKFLPTYNALEDPYLSEFFAKPKIKKHLKEVHMIKRRKKG